MTLCVPHSKWRPDLPSFTHSCSSSALHALSKNPTCPTSLSLDDKSALVVRSVHNSWFTGTWSFYLFIWHYTRVLYSLLDDTCALGSTAVCVHDLWPRTVTLMLTEYMPEDLFTYTGQWTVTETLPSCSCIMKSVI